ncbi:MAG: PD-(D/E)XK nuclease family protein [Candidatus Altiarchaeia archaeon]
MKVAVSTLNAYSFCPREVYLSEVLGLAPDSLSEMQRGVFGQDIRKKLAEKQIALLGVSEDIPSLLSSLREELNSIFEGVRKKYPLISAEDASKVKSEVITDLGAFSGRLSYIAEDIGLERALRKMTPWKVDYSISSERLGLSGRIDKVMKEAIYYPVEIKTCSPPESVWEGDRIQVCAYGLLLEEDLALKKKIPYGFVEYARIPEMRPVMYTDSLRKSVMDTRDSVFELLEGAVPDICPHGNGRKCESCGYAKRCYEI